MPKVSNERKLKIRKGSYFTESFPDFLIKLMNWKEGDIIEFETDQVCGGIIMKNRRRFIPNVMELAQATEYLFSKKMPKTFKKAMKQMSLEGRKWAYNKELDKKIIDEQNPTKEHIKYLQDEKDFLKKEIRKLNDEKDSLNDQVKVKKNSIKTVEFLILTAKENFKKKQGGKKQAKKKVPKNKT
jgi:hypothetical protein